MAHFVISMSDMFHVLMHIPALCLGEHLILIELNLLLVISMILEKRHLPWYLNQSGEISLGVEYSSGKQQ